jgi:hypothetical protein
MTIEEFPENRRVLALQIEEILRRADAMPELDNRSAEEILGYDTYGMPN